MQASEGRLLAALREEVVAAEGRAEEARSAAAAARRTAARRETELEVLAAPGHAVHGHGMVVTMSREEYLLP